MEHDLEQQLRQRIAQLERENSELREFNDLLKAQRKEHLDIILGPVRDSELPTEEQYVELMRTRVPAEQVYRELGIPFGRSNP